MKRIKDIHISGLIIFLMIMRIFVGGKWFGCVVLSGLLVSILDIIKKLYESNLHIVGKKQKFRYGIWFLVLNLFLFLGLILILLNIILEIKWLNSTIVLDEITLLTLLLTLPQNYIVHKINKRISK